MRSVRTALVLLAIVSMPSIARGQARDCVETTPDLNDAIACLKGMYRPQLENCQKAPLRGWSAPVEGRRVQAHRWPAPSSSPATFVHMGSWLS
jgi:hypothetical protein